MDSTARHYDCHAVAAASAAAEDEGDDHGQKPLGHGSLSKSRG